MKKRIIHLLTAMMALLAATTSWAVDTPTPLAPAHRIRGTVTDGREPLAGAMVQLMRPDSTLVTGVAANADGTFSLRDLDKGNYLLSISCLGYETATLSLHNVESDVNIGQVALSMEGKMLNDVEVTASRQVNKIDRQLLIPSKAQIASSNNGVSLLQRMQLDRIQVDALKGSITTTLGEAVQLRINGVQATIKEVQALQPRDVLRIEYHDMPGLRYGNAAAVLDYIVKHKTAGGSFSVSGRQGVSLPGAGDYQTNGSWHNGRSEVKASGNWSRRRLKWTRENYETFVYPTDTLYNQELGEPTPVGYDNVDLSAAYIHTGEKNMVSITLRDQLDNNPDEMSSRVSTLHQGGKIYRVNDHLSTWSNSPSLDLYWQTDLPCNQHLYFDLVGTYIDSRSDRDYTMGTSANDISSAITSHTRGDKYSLIGEAIYEKFWGNSKLSFGLKHTWQHVRNSYAGSVEATVRMHTDDTYGYGEYQRQLGSLTWNVGLGLTRSAYNQEGNKRTTYVPRPNWMLAYGIGKHVYLKYHGYVSSYSPSLSDLNDVSQPIDAYQIQRGNPHLKTVTFVSNDLMISWNTPHLRLMAGGRYSYDHRPMMASTYDEGGIFVRTTENQLGFHRLQTQLSLTYKPWKDGLSIRLTPFFNRYVSLGHAYTHTYSNWGLRGYITAIYRHWVAEMSFRTRYKSLWGETITDTENGHNLALGYNPGRWSISLEVYNPFSNHYSLTNVDLSRLAPARKVTRSKDFCHLFFVNASLNLDFGKKHEGKQKRISNRDEDTGVMIGKK